MEKRKGILAIRSLKIRAFVLFVICAPVFFPVLRNLEAKLIFMDEVPKQILALLPFVIYSILLIFVIALTLGVSGLTKIVAASAATAVTVSVTRGVLPKLPVIGAFLQGSKPDSDSSFSAALQLVEMFVLIPAPIFFVRCFPPSDVLSKIKSNGGGDILIIAAIVSRMSTAIYDGVFHFLVAWQEENPKILFPRHKSELGSSQKILKFPFWFLGAMKTWCFALVVYSLEQIPPLIHQTNSFILKNGGRHDK